MAARRAGWRRPRWSSHSCQSFVSVCLYNVLSLELFSRLEVASTTGTDIVVPVARADLQPGRQPPCLRFPAACPFFIVKLRLERRSLWPVRVARGAWELVRQGPQGVRGGLWSYLVRRRRRRRRLPRRGRGRVRQPGRAPRLLPRPRREPRGPRPVGPAHRNLPENHRVPVGPPQPPRRGLDEQPGGDTSHAVDSLLPSSLSRPLPSTSFCFIGLCACSSHARFLRPLFPSSFINNIYTTSTQPPTASSPRAPPPETRRRQRTKTRPP